jgi:hypothetical protein
MIRDYASKLKIRSLGHRPADTLRYAYQRSGIGLTTTTAGYGGVRTWFLCPSYDRRSSVLYDNAVHGWICRICCDGRYASEVESPIHRLYRKVRKLRRRLGQTDLNLTLPFPGKPTGMHWSTYLRLRKEGLALETSLFDYLGRNLPGPARVRMLNEDLKSEDDSVENCINVPMPRNGDLP